jgi:hypothetical protein
MNSRRVAPAAFFIASVFTASLMPSNGKASSCHTGQSDSSQSCCGATYQVQHFRCDAGAAGIELIQTGSQTLCECAGETIRVETYQAGEASCSC